MFRSCHACRLIVTLRTCASCHQSGRISVQSMSTHLRGRLESSLPTPQRQEQQSESCKQHESAMKPFHNDKFIESYYAVSWNITGFLSVTFDDRRWRATCRVLHRAESPSLALPPLFPNFIVRAPLACRQSFSSARSLINRRLFNRSKHFLPWISKNCNCTSTLGSLKADRNQKS
jgi:hypothetical protein